MKYLNHSATGMAVAFSLALAACGGGGSASLPVTTSPTTDPSTVLSCSVASKAVASDAAVTLQTGTVTVAAAARDYFEYAPANVADLREYDARGVRVVISLHDEGQDGSVNARRTRWSEIADANGFVVVFPNAVGGKWNLKRDPAGADEIEYIRAVAAAVRTKYGLTATIPTYLTGVGAGGAMAQQVAMMAPNVATAVAGIGGVADASTFSLPATDLPTSAMSAWLVKQGDTLALDAAESRQVEFWKTANGTGATAQTECGTVAETQTFTHPDNPVQQVRVSRLVGVDRADSKEVSQMIWDGMFDGVIRFADDLRTNGTLHRNETIASMKLVETTKELQPGSPRRWLTYVPSNYAALAASGRKLPVVFSFHGRNGSARFQALISEWHKVAEEKGFIVVYPQGIGATWQVPMDPAPRDLQFFLDLLEETKRTYAVDTTRVYLNGSSMGTAMSNRIAVQYPQLIAAAALCYSGHLGASSYGHALVRTDVPLPVWQCRGAEELPSEFPGGTAGETAARNFWRETVNKNMGPAQSVVDGRRRMEIWNDGVAEYRWQLTDHIGHFWHPGQARVMWDEMLSRYSRAPDGSLVRN